MTKCKHKLLSVKSICNTYFSNTKFLRVKMQANLSEHEGSASSFLWSETFWHIPSVCCSYLRGSGLIRLCELVLLVNAEITWWWGENQREKFKSSLHRKWRRKKHFNLTLPGNGLRRPVPVTCRWALCPIAWGTCQFPASWRDVNLQLEKKTKEYKNTFESPW